MSFEDVDRKVREALSKQNIVFRTAEEEDLANFTMLLTENAQKEALEYSDAHLMRLAFLHEDQIKKGLNDAYSRGNPNALLPEGVLEDANGLYTMQDGKRSQYFFRDPRKPGTQFYLTEAYEKNGIEGIVQALRDKGLGADKGTTGFTGKSSNDVLRLQEQVVEHVKSNNLAGQILHGPSLADIKNAMHAEEVQAATESVSMARRTLQNIIEGSELAAKVMRFRV